MSSKLVKGTGNGGGIVNPFAKKILTIDVTDDGQTNISSPLPPDEVCKILANIMIDLQFRYITAAIDQAQKQESRIALTDVGNDVRN